MKVIMHDDHNDDNKVVSSEVGSVLGPGLVEVERLLGAGDWSAARAQTLSLVTSLPLPPLHAVMLRCR